MAITPGLFNMAGGAFGGNALPVSNQSELSGLLDFLSLMQSQGIDLGNPNVDLSGFNVPLQQGFDANIGEGGTPPLTIQQLLGNLVGTGAVPPLANTPTVPDLNNPVFPTGAPTALNVNNPAFLPDVPTVPDINNPVFPVDDVVEQDDLIVPNNNPGINTFI